MAEVVTVVGMLAAVAAAPIGAMAAYLLALTAAAFVRRTVPPPEAARSTRFAILVPAHNEALVIERLLASLAAQRYPRDNYDVYVVADNCSDETAALSRRAGAIVHERRDDARRAKGYALRWLLEIVRARTTYGAYLVFDADSVITPNFLLRMDARLAAGSRVVQAYYGVLNGSDSPVAALREAALASLHLVRPLGRSALGLSCGLKGNGMCFEARTLERQGWASVGLAEDVELHLALVRQRVRVDFAPEAVVRADMPVTLAAAYSQNVRWEAGRLATVRGEVIGLLRDGLMSRDLVQIDAAVEQLVPPLSVAIAMSFTCALVGAITGNTAAVALGLFGTGGLMLHVLAGLVAARAPATVYRALMLTPAYLVWKLMLYARATKTPAGHAWVRTERQRSEGPKQ
jgi:cellulose synthase/poly-beta-1,6-N-acetylglucosamine synthase-like glycosyltransferase